ncbi:outer membrane protein [Ferrovibrio xuzhouensis]|uniref:Outer membrane protein n=1 Tax=Ferrovibrio xuzhouensis TaxID=1576914 RepID=A0ABV7VF99_9PROT
MRAALIALIVTLAGGIGSGALAQPAPGAIDWSGFYVSSLAGATNGNADMKTVTGRLQYFDATDAAQIARVGKNDIDQWRPSGGLAGGYGVQFGNVLVGIEVSANTLFLDEEHVRSETYITVPTAQFRIKQSVSADWMATLRPRLGWAQDNWLGYVTGGIAATQMKMHTLFTDNAFSGYSEASKSKLVAGWSLGFGGEYALGNNWSLRGDYLFTRFGEVNSVSDVTSTNNSGGTMNHSADLDVHGLFIGVTYHFH